MVTSSTGVVDELEQLVDELFVICESKDLSIESLHAKTKLLPSQTLSRLYSSLPFFHAACMNENITLEIIEYLLEVFPLVENLPTAYFCPDETTTSYALHCACYNNYCPNEVVELLVKNNSDALNHFCLVGYGISDEMDYAREYRNRGLPLHYYLSRNKIDIDTVKMLVEACPQTLVDVNDMSLPLIHVALSNDNMKIDDLRDIIIFFLSQEQSSRMIRMRDTFLDSTPLHKVCIKEGLTLELFQLIFNAWPEAIRLTDDLHNLPIHQLCCNEKMDDTASLDILRFMLNVDPTVLWETNEDYDYLPIDHAISIKSYAFCKMMIDAYRESVTARINWCGYLPIHGACFGSRDDTVDTIQYILELHPELGS